MVTFLSLGFTVVNMLLLATSILPLLYSSLGSPLAIRQACVWFIVVSSVFQLISSVDRVSLIPTMPTKFHQHLQSWIHSMPVTPGSRPFPPHFGGTMCCGFHPKYPLKFHQNDCWMTCHPPQLPQPPPSFFTLFFIAWTCWTHTLHSWFAWLLFQEGK